MYIDREIEKAIDHMITQGKVVLVTGDRQVGKTTVLKHHLGKEFNYVTMDDVIAREQAKNDAVLFFDMHSLPLIIDEVQRVPELFLPVKWKVDQADEKGRIILTGSQTYHLMKDASESLAGRIRILEMPALSSRGGGSRRTTEEIPSMHMEKSAYEPACFGARFPRCMLRRCTRCTAACRRGPSAFRRDHASWLYYERGSTGGQRMAWLATTMVPFFSLP